MIAGFLLSTVKPGIPGLFYLLKQANLKKYTSLYNALIKKCALLLSDNIYIAILMQHIKARHLILKL
jgi:hypothetical protein